MARSCSGKKFFFGGKGYFYPLKKEMIVYPLLKRLSLVPRNLDNFHPNTKFCSLERVVEKVIGP